MGRLLQEIKSLPAAQQRELKIKTIAFIIEELRLIYMNQEKNKIVALNALDECHTEIHRIIDRTKNNANRDLIKADLARTIAIAANALSLL